MTAGQGPARGEVWLVDLDPTRGHEQAGKRPALVISSDSLNQSPAGLVVVLPITSKAKNVRSHVRVDPPEAGLTLTSYVKCEDVRSVSTQRLMTKWGRVGRQTMSTVEEVMRALFEL